MGLYELLFVCLFAIVVAVGWSVIRQRKRSFDRQFRVGSVWLSDGDPAACSHSASHKMSSVQLEAARRWICDRRAAQYYASDAAAASTNDDCRVGINDALTDAERRIDRAWRERRRLELSAV